MTRWRFIRTSFVALLLSLLLLQGKAFAYLDPATGSYILQLVLGILFGALFALKVFWSKVKSFFIHLFSKR